MNITFFRPNTGASIIYTNIPGASNNTPAEIDLISPGGNTSWVKIEANGQVSIGQ